MSKEKFIAYASDTDEPWTAAKKEITREALKTAIGPAVGDMMFVRGLTVLIKLRSSYPGTFYVFTDSNSTDVQELMANVTWGLEDLVFCSSATSNNLSEFDNLRYAIPTLRPRADKRFEFTNKNFVDELYKAFLPEQLSKTGAFAPSEIGLLDTYSSNFMQEFNNQSKDEKRVENVPRIIIPDFKVVPSMFNLTNNEEDLLNNYCQANLIALDSVLSRAQLNGFYYRLNAEKDLVELLNPQLEKVGETTRIIADASGLCCVDEMFIYQVPNQQERYKNRVMNGGAAFTYWVGAPDGL